MMAFLQKIRALEVLEKLDHLEARSNLTRQELHKRDQYMATVIAIGAPAVPALVRRLVRVADADPTASVVWMLEQIGEAAVPCLAQAKHAGDAQLRHNAIALLGRIGTPSALRELEDESVDLMDKQVVEAALLQARHHHPATQPAPHWPS